ncbi:MAG: zinc-ribbon domain-containing protein [Promethearchaeota archaeon]
MNIKRDKKGIRKSQKIMFCENCGADLQDPNQLYCPNCGIPLNIKVFKYSDLRKTFEEGKMIKHLYEILDSDYTLLFVDSKRFRI